MILEPLFLGAEICEITEGPYEGSSVYVPERDRGVALGRTLTGKQCDRAVLYPSMLSTGLPPEIGGPVDGRHIGGAGRDTRSCRTPGCRPRTCPLSNVALLGDLIGVYLDRLAPAHRAQRKAEIDAHIDETHIAWIGDPKQVPFYYRLHSPTLWIEIDHHPALMLERPMEPSTQHVHTIMRAPNGGDYGMAHLRR